MFQSKALKEDSEYKEPSKLYLWWIETTVSEYYYRFVHKFITDPIYQVKRLVQWYWNVFRFDYDFDGHCLYAIIEYKLKRVDHSLYSGNSVHEDKDLKALKLAIKLAGRLKDDNYDMVAWERLQKKWGKLQSWTTPCEDKKDMLQWHSKFSNVKTPEDEEACNKERRYGYTVAYNKMLREQRWFYSLLNKHLRSWWD